MSTAVDRTIKSNNINIFSTQVTSNWCCLHSITSQLLFTILIRPYLEISESPRHWTCCSSETLRRCSPFWFTTTDASAMTCPLVIGCKCEIRACLGVTCLLLIGQVLLGHTRRNECDWVKVCDWYCMEIWATRETSEVPADGISCRTLRWEWITTQLGVNVCSLFASSDEFTR